MPYDFMTPEQIAAKSPGFRALTERVEQRRRERLEAEWDDASSEEEARELDRNRDEALKVVRGFIRDKMDRIGVDRDALNALRALNWELSPVRSALDFLESNTEERRFLILCGPKGTGKTVAAALVVQEHLRIDAGRSRPSGNEWAYVDRATWALSSSLARLSLYDRDDKAGFETACRTPLLVVDDYGAEFKSEVSRGLLEELFMRRYGDWKRTVLTTNLDPDALKDQLGERLVDRINAACIVCVCQGESMRRQRLA